MKSKDIIDDIEKLVFEGKVRHEVSSELGISIPKLDNLINSLKTLNNERYKKIKTKQIENAALKKLESSRKNSKNVNLRFNGYFVPNKNALKVASGELSILDAAKLSMMSILAFFKYLIEIRDEKFSKIFKPILREYGFGLSENRGKGKSLLSYPLSFQNEVVLLALTYRVSIKTIAKMFGTTPEDVLYTFISFDKLEESLGYLFLETVKEDEINEKYSKEQALRHWKKRNELVEKYNETKKILKEYMEKDNKEQIAFYSEELKERKAKIDVLYSKINNGMLKETTDKNASYLTQDEKDIIARYPLKYYLPIDVCSNDLGRSNMFITNCMESLAKRDMIFAEKLSLYNMEMQKLSSCYINNTYIPFANQDNPNNRR